MNIAAIKAYSTAAGVRPTLPARSTVTDAFDGSDRSVAQKSAGIIDAQHEPTKHKEPFTLFNAYGRLETISGINKGGIFDARA